MLRITNNSFHLISDNSLYIFIPNIRSSDVADVLKRYVDYLHYHNIKTPIQLNYDRIIQRITLEFNIKIINELFIAKIYELFIVGITEMDLLLDNKECTFITLTTLEMEKEELLDKINQINNYYTYINCKANFKVNIINCEDKKVFACIEVDYDKN